MNGLIPTLVVFALVFWYGPTITRFLNRAGKRAGAASFRWLAGFFHRRRLKKIRTIEGAAPPSSSDDEITSTYTKH